MIHNFIKEIQLEDYFICELANEDYKWSKYVKMKAIMKIKIDWKKLTHQMMTSFNGIIVELQM